MDAAPTSALHAATPPAARLRVMRPAQGAAGSTFPASTTMSLNRPIGHIAGNLAYAAHAIAHRVRYYAPVAVHVLWLADDGCLYLQHAAHPAARAIERTAPQQVVMRYRKQAEFGWRDIHADLQQARADFATAAMQEAAA